MSDANKPIDALCAFASALGWSPLRLRQHDATGEAPVTWYESGDVIHGRSAFFFQINERPIGNPRTYEAAVYAIRFRIYTGWREFQLDAALNFNLAEAKRLESLLHRRLFVSPATRKLFRANHPECANYSWQRVRETGRPITKNIFE